MNTNQQTAVWVSGGKRKPQIDNLDNPKEYIVRVKGDDPRTGWVQVDFFTADEMHNENFCNEYWEWLDESPSEQKTAEEVCQNCGGENPAWSATNDLWNAVTGSPNGILCPTCFVKMANEKDINLFGLAAQSPDLINQLAYETGYADGQSTPQGESDAVELDEFAEELWDDHSQSFGNDIDDATFWAGKDIMSRSEFMKALKQIAKLYTITKK